MCVCVWLYVYKLPISIHTLPLLVLSGNEKTTPEPAFAAELAVTTVGKKPPELAAGTRDSLSYSLSRFISSLL